MLGNPKGERGFQILVFPYKEDYVTEERFRMDIPSGSMENPQNILIDGVPGTIFYSTDATLGETREVWFIHNGFLYEITAPKIFDPWLSEILLDFRFLSLP